tara:strand:- start:167 stop:445 length:279 start_codon:yes stop_codon:yes gene_type:complete
LLPDEVNRCNTKKGRGFAKAKYIRVNMKRTKYIVGWLLKWLLKSIAVLSLLILSLSGLVKILELHKLEETILVPLIYFTLWFCMLIKIDENG